MSWSNKQKGIAARACKGWMADEHRRMILGYGEFGGRAFFDRNGNRSKVASTTSKRLTQRDFELFMSIVESCRDRPVEGFSKRYWEERANEGTRRRMRFHVQKLANTLELTCYSDADAHLPDSDRRRALEPHGVGLRGWVRNMTNGRTDDLDDCVEGELYALAEGLKAYGRRHGVRWPSASSSLAVLSQP